MKNDRISQNLKMKINNTIKIYLFLFLFLSSWNGGNHECRKKLFNQVKEGMTKEEVIGVLGLPDTVYYSIVDSSECDFIYFYKENQFKSKLPTINFDSGRVKFAEY